MFFGKDNRSRTSLASLLLAVNLLLAACASGSSLETPLPDDPTTTRTGQLTPYISPTAPFATGETPRSNLPAPTPPPTPTPTPRTHEVKKGEDMGGIAWLYRVSLEALMEANPTVQPNMMSVGTRLIIPPSKTEATGGDAPIDPGAASQTPTPVPLSAGRLTCTRVEDGGVWCFMPVQNTQSFALEGLSAVFRLADEQAQTVLMQRAFLPLDTLPAGVSLPLAAYFPPEQAAGLAFPYQFSSEIIS
ncbi:MAG: LysM peptidoglycan-binding domain-containing protein, partial [Chloroflexi bacterium]